MNEKRNLLILLMIVIIGIYGNTYAQHSIYIKETNGNLIQIPLTQVKKITFSGNNMLLHKTDSSIINWAIVDIQKYYYDSTTSIDHFETKENIDVLIYPNPSNGNFNLNYKVKHRGVVKIYILSIDGKLIKSVFTEKKNQGYYHLYISENFKQGSYFIKIATQNNLITKKIIILK